MRGDDRDRVHHRIAGGVGLVLQSRRNPDRRNPEGRLPRLPAGQHPAVGVAETASSSGPSVCQRPISIPRRLNRYSRGFRRRLSLMCTGGTRKPSPPKDGAAARAPGSEAARPASRPPANQLGSQSPASDPPGQQLHQIVAGASPPFFFSATPASAATACGARAFPRPPAQTRIPATLRNATLGSPGISAHRSANHAGNEKSGRLGRVAENLGAQQAGRVGPWSGVMPQAIETSSEGMMVTSPSPTVRIVYVRAASPSSTPCWRVPISSRRRCMMQVIRIVASESRWLKRAAPVHRRRTPHLRAIAWPAACLLLVDQTGIHVGTMAICLLAAHPA